jgi:hypothetical protein
MFLLISTIEEKKNHNVTHEPRHHKVKSLGFALAVVKLIINLVTIFSLVLNDNSPKF